MINEIWKDIEGYEGLYQVSNTGKVKSLQRFKKGRRRLSGEHCSLPVREKLLKYKTDKDGYLSATLSKNGKNKEFRVSRLVAQAFILNASNLPVVHHKDECVTNNNVENLEWMTNRDNLFASDSFGKLAKIHGSAIVQKDLDGNIISKYPSSQEASRVTGLDVRHISAVVNGKRRHTRGNVFERVVSQ